MATRTTRAASQAHNNNKHENMKIFQKQFQNARRRKHPIPICRHGGGRLSWMVRSWENKAKENNLN